MGQHIPPADLQAFLTRVIARWGERQDVDHDDLHAFFGFAMQEAERAGLPVADLSLNEFRQGFRAVLNEWQAAKMQSNRYLAALEATMRALQEGETVNEMLRRRGLANLEDFFAEEGFTGDLAALVAEVEAAFREGQTA